MVKVGKSRVRRSLVALAAMAALTACANDRGPHSDLPPLGAEVEFLSRNLCGEGVSPAVRLGGVPANTDSYRVRLTNISVLTAPRWEATIKADASHIPEGAMTNFDPPCPGDQQVLTYRLEVMALAGDGRPLAYGWTFPHARSLVRQLQQERAEIKRQPSERPDRVTTPAPRRPPFFIQ